MGVQMLRRWCGMTIVDLLNISIAITGLIVGVISLVITLIDRH